MADDVEELIFYGDDVRLERFPRETRLVYPPAPLPAVPDARSAIAAALDVPIGSAPLERRLSPASRVTIAFDDLCVPVPPMRQDLRRLVIEELLRRLARIGVAPERLRLVCANGLHRKWTPKELELVLGAKVMRELGAARIACHDGTREDELAHLGLTPSGAEVEINRAVLDADLTIYVNVSFTSMNGGWKSVAVGLGSWRSIRQHHGPQQWNGVDSLLDPEHSPMHRMVREMGALIASRCDVFQIECVLDNRLWAPPLDSLLHPLGGRRATVPRRAALKLAALPPQRLKEALRDRLRSSYGLRAVHAGEVEAVHALTLEHLRLQQNVAVREPADVLILGVPNLSPYSVLSVFNPILLRSVLLGYHLGMFERRRLLRRGGILVAYNPGLETFSHRHHPSYVDFWLRDLDRCTDPERCWQELAEVYANDAVYLDRYRNDYAYHGAHCLMNWAWSGMALRSVGAVILAGAKEPATARKLGFVPAADLQAALCMARERAGMGASVAYQVTPPLFAVDVEEERDGEGAGP